LSLQFEFALTMINKSLRRPRILYVEDSPADAALLRQAFEIRGQPFSLTVLNDGQAALDFVRSTPPLPDVVIMDLELPTVDGLTVLKSLKADGRWHRVPVLVFVDPCAPNARIAKSLGADLCLAKPMDWIAWPKLIETIRELSTHETAQHATG
jgi:CheY-like chemotaxis protein